MHCYTPVVVDQNGVKRIAPYSIYEDYSSYEKLKFIEKLTSKEEGTIEKCKKEQQTED